MITLQLLPPSSPPLTLIPCYNLRKLSPSTSSKTPSSVIISLFIAVFLTSICFRCVNSVAIKSLSAPSHVKAKSCFQTTDCHDPHKECVDNKCQCKSFFDYIPEQDSCAKTYGASCTIFEGSTEELCNINKYLACDETGTCSCHREGNSTLIYDPYLETCAAPPSHQCELMSWSNVKKKCVRNAKCVQNPNQTVDAEFFGICKCTQDFVAKGEKCVPKIGSQCQLNGDCDQEGMRCLEGKCACDEDRIYFENGHDCKVKVGETCELAHRDCVDYAQCRGTRNGLTSHWEWQCRCQLGYHETPENGTCVKDWHGNCKDLMVYDDSRGRCSLKVGRSCVESEVNLCVKHAFCGTGNKCQCFDGYEMTFNETCEKARNEIKKKTTKTIINFESSTVAMTIETPEARKQRGGGGNEQEINEYKSDTNNSSPGRVVFKTVFVMMTIWLIV